MSLRFDEHTGRLLHEDPPAVTLMMPWPLMTAFRRSTPRGPWMACHPGFSLPPDADVRVEQTAGFEGLAELRKFCGLVPRDVRESVGRFPEGHWHLLAWVARGGPAAEELLASNPTLAFAVASGAELVVADTPVNFVQRQPLMAYHTQRDLLARLGFPPTDRVRRILRKCQPQHVTLARLVRLRDALADEAVRERLAHVPVINGGVLRVVEDGTLRNISPAALGELARVEEEGAATRAARQLAEVIRLWGLVRPTMPPPRFERLDRIEQEHAVVRQDVRRLPEPFSRPFPLPPVAGSDSIVHIANKAMLIEEGRIQKNCAGDYAARAARGTLVFYRVIQPQRCTLSLQRSKGVWVVEQLKASCNTPASLEARRAVNNWLMNAKLGARG
jgi:hypothetical protein